MPDETSRPSDPMPTRGDHTRDPHPAEIIPVRVRRVACDGVGGVLGHPRVYLEMGEADFVECPYCDRRFVIAGPERVEPEVAAPGVYEGPGGH